VISNQSEEDGNNASFGDLLEESESFDQPRRGDIRPALILQISPTEIIVDLGGKRDGVVPKEDLDRLAPDYIQSLNAGEEVPVYILNPNDRDGNMLVSINLGLQGQDWVRAHQLLESGDLVESEVTGYNRGGLLVRFGRLEGFVPASHILELDPGLPEPDRSEAMDNLIGQSIGLKVIEVNQGRRRLILSQREAQREWRTQQKQRLLDELEIGDVVTGRVTGIRDFGVFVDLGGADGLIHVSELAWHRVPHPRDVVKVGDELTVHVLELDREKQRIALSLRRLQADPWNTVEERYAIGEVVEGTVSNVVDFGAFVVLEDGIEGLLHVSEMADGTLTEPYSYIRRGDKVSVRVARIEPSRKRIGFTQQGLYLEGPTDAPRDLDAEPIEEEADDLDVSASDLPEDAPPEAEVEVEEEDEAAPSETPDDAPPLDEELPEDGPAAEVEVEEEDEAAPSETPDDAPPPDEELPEDGPAAEVEVEEEDEAAPSETPDDAPPLDEEPPEDGPAAEVEVEEEDEAAPSETPDDAPPLDEEPPEDGPAAEMESGEEGAAEEE